MGSSYIRSEEPDTTVWIEVPCLDLVHRHLYRSSKFLTLLRGNRGAQILDFGSMLSHKDTKTTSAASGIPLIQEQRMS